MVDNVEDLFDVFFKGDVDLLKRNIHLLQQADKDYGLILCAENGFIDVIKIFVENGANIRTNKGEAIRIAEKNGHKDVVDYFLMYEKEKNQTNRRCNNF